MECYCSDNLCKELVKSQWKFWVPTEATNLRQRTVFQHLVYSLAASTVHRLFLLSSSIRSARIRKSVFKSQDSGPWQQYLQLRLFALHVARPYLIPSISYGSSILPEVIPKSQEYYLCTVECDPKPPIPKIFKIL